MEKILELTQEQFSDFKNSKQPKRFLKKLLGINEKSKTGGGYGQICAWDKSFNPQPLEVYKIQSGYND